MPETERIRQLAHDVRNNLYAMDITLMASSSETAPDRHERLITALQSELEKTKQNLNDLLSLALSEET